MGRKSNSKQISKKTSGKEVSKFEIQKRKDLAVLVDKLLKLTSVFQATVSLSKSWEHYLEIDSILRQIKELETPKTKVETKCRKTNLEQFQTWLRENGAQFEGIEVCEFEGYDLGLKAAKEFTEGSLLLTVPRKVMMTEQNAKESDLSEFISVDPLLQNMPNITLALFLLLQKNSPDSFWKPYIDILPHKYSTILYFTPEELSELKPSPTLESSLKLFRSIARQYAYFYNKIYTLDIPVLKNLQEIFTFDNYRWAVSSVMTRQNNVKFLEQESTAFIPLWDMCNHEHGKITTDFNVEADRGECVALRDFKAGEQIFIFYGARSNSDLFLHNGFVYPNNQHDFSLSIALGISASDPLRDQRLQLLGKLGLANVTHFSLYRAPLPLSAELLAFIRIFSMDQDDLTKWSAEGVPSDLVSSDAECAERVGPAVDGKAYQYLLTRCRLLRKLYERTEGQGDEQLTVHRKNIKLLKECEVQYLDGAIKYLESVIEKLPTVIVAQ